MSKFIRSKRFLTIFTAAALIAPILAPSAYADVVRYDDTQVGKKLNLPVYKWCDSSVPTKDIVFAIHGATLYARRFEWAAQHLAKEGYPVYALDLRGFGRWRTEGAKFAYGDTGVHYGMSEKDIVQVLQEIKANNPNKKIICMGESLGANLAIWVGSDHANLIDGMILVSPCIKPVLHFSPKSPLYMVHGLLNHDWHMPLGKPIKKYISDDKSVTAEYLSDPNMYYELSAAEFYKSIKTNTLTLADKEKIPAGMPVLVIAGQIDHVYQTAAVKPFVSEMGSEHKTVAVMPNRGHLLIEQPKVSPEVLSIIDHWLQTSETADVAQERTNEAATAVEPTNKTADAAPTATASRSTNQAPPAMPSTAQAASE
ncbi:MAG TPA: alpha/beta fold hydrolase [Trichormus sp.]